jgi:hypothetical protein
MSVVMSADNLIQIEPRYALTDILNSNVSYEALLATHQLQRTKTWFNPFRYQPDPEKIRAFPHRALRFSSLRLGDYRNLDTE